MKTLSEHIEVTAGVAGSKPRITGHRITVQNIVIWHEFMGMSPDQIATEYGLTLGDIHAALAYYHEHRQEIDDSIRAEQAFAEEVRAHSPMKRGRFQ